MFKLEELGYNKNEVNKYLVETLKKIEKFEETINSQKDEIKSLEKRIEVLTSQKDIKYDSERIDYEEHAKEEADYIINQALLDINDLTERINQAILRELEK